MSTSSPASADLPVPPKEQLRAIAKAQDEKHEALHASKNHGEEEVAAKLIQRNYRGYRERRQLEGLRLDASTRWVEAIKEARYRNATRPRSRHESNPPLPKTDAVPQTGRARGNSEPARETWRRVATIALRAGSDDHQSDTSSVDTGALSPQEKEERKKRKIEAKRLRDKSAQRMQLQYYLELVDSKHRYGSNLRAYHEEWKKADTHENFFYWLDQGEGKNLEVPTCSRERLEREQVRYLSREERLSYLVKIDDGGRLCWAKNGERVSTSIEYRDSINGIVPITDHDTPEFRSPGGSASRNTTSSSSSSSSSSASSIFSASGSPEGEHYVNNDLQQTKGVKKIKHISAAALLDHLLRKSVKPNSWIFVADTSFRLYVGIKQSGAFQHSSFLHGSRISAAGLLKVKDGLLTQLSPLSGHYRPPTSNFRAFVHALRDAGVDMSHVSISRSYAVLVGLEAWVKTRRRVKSVGEVLKRSEEAVLRPEDAKERKEREMDHSNAARREAEFLRSEEEERKKGGWKGRLGRRLGRRVEPVKTWGENGGDTKGKVPMEANDEGQQEQLKGEEFRDEPQREERKDAETAHEKVAEAGARVEDGDIESAAQSLAPTREDSVAAKDTIEGNGVTDVKK